MNLFRAKTKKINQVTLKVKNSNAPNTKLFQKIYLFNNNKEKDTTTKKIN